MSWRLKRNIYNSKKISLSHLYRKKEKRHTKTKNVWDEYIKGLLHLEQVLLHSRNVMSYRTFKASDQITDELEIGVEKLLNGRLPWANSVWLINDWNMIKLAIRWSLL